MRDDTRSPIDFDFLGAQTFGDLDLQAEVLDLFVTQAHRLLPLLAGAELRAQDDMAHLLKGSARSIGAMPMAEHAAALEEAEPADRARIQADLAEELARVETAIAAWHRASQADAGATI